MTDNHPITPPPELVGQWLEDSPEDDELGIAGHIATQAARWGADQELLACGNYLERCAAWEEEDVTEMYNYRRPRPPSLKEQALLAIDTAVADGRLSPAVSNVVRRALEQLDD